MAGAQVADESLPGALAHGDVGALGLLGVPYADLRAQIRDLDALRAAAAAVGRLEPPSVFVFHQNSSQTWSRNAVLPVGTR